MEKQIKMSNKLQYFLNFLLVCCMLFTVEDSHSQTKPAVKNAIGTLPQEEENLNVFQKWIRWNNPGSLLINYLTKQAGNYYDIRGREIAELKTRNDW
ncbi:MAG: hypothetical protein ABIR66_03040, partial [Saprospiraceae bacterium]